VTAGIEGFGGLSFSVDGVIGGEYPVPEVRSDRCFECSTMITGPRGCRREGLAQEACLKA
jgi:hypothetical protein